MAEELTFWLDKEYHRKEAMQFAWFATFVAFSVAGAFLFTLFWQAEGQLTYLYWLGVFCAVGLGFAAKSASDKSRQDVQLYVLDAKGITNQHGFHLGWSAVRGVERTRSGQNFYFLYEKSVGFAVSSLSPVQLREMKEFAGRYLPDRIAAKL